MVVKFTKTEIGMWLPRARGREELVFNAYRVSVLQGGNVLEMR